MNQKPELSKGSIIISEPFLSEIYFKRAVILLSDHDNTGTLGFILNKQTDVTINDAVEDFAKFNAPLYFGGPIETDTLFYIHTIGENLQDAKRITDGIYLGGNYEQLKLMIETRQVTPKMIRFYAGYSGWDPDQLKHEVEEKTWMLPTFNREIVFSEDPNNLWRKVLKSMGGECAIMANYPEDPSLN